MLHVRWQLRAWKIDTHVASDQFVTIADDRSDGWKVSSNKTKTVFFTEFLAWVIPSTCAHACKYEKIECARSVVDPLLEIAVVFFLNTFFKHCTGYQIGPGFSTTCCNYRTVHRTQLWILYSGPSRIRERSSALTHTGYSDKFSFVQTPNCSGETRSLASVCDVSTSSWAHSSGRVVLLLVPCSAGIQWFNDDRSLGDKSRLVSVGSPTNIWSALGVVSGVSSVVKYLPEWPVLSTQWHNDTSFRQHPSIKLTQAKWTDC